MLKEFWSALLDILWPKSCQVCSKILKNDTDRLDDYLCTDCFLRFTKNPVLACSLCGTNLSKKSFRGALICQECGKKPPAYDRLLSCYTYDGPTKDLIQKFKYENKPYLAKTLVTLMEIALEGTETSFFQEINLIMPVPLHPVRFREREFNQSELLAQEFSQRIGKPLCRELIKKRNTKPQMQLNKAARFLNLRGAFQLKDTSKVYDQNIMIIDDVVTTTATVREASQTLKEAGAKKIYILSFAKRIAA